MSRFAQQWRLEPSADQMIVAGIDALGQPFTLQLDRVWAANLCIELEEWLAGRVGDATLDA